MIYYTTIEQAEHLVELGLDPETADMCWTNHCYGQIRSSMRVSSKTVKEYKELLIRFADKTSVDVFIPCWSIGALLELMPESYQLTRGKDNKYQFMLFHILIHDWFNTPFEAVYNMICYLLENGYIKKA